MNPLLAIRKVDFLDLLFKARSNVYKEDIVQKAWKNAGCWPIDINRAGGVPASTGTGTGTGTRSASSVSAHSASHGAHIPDTPLLLCSLARNAEQALFDNNVDTITKRSLFHSLIDTTTEKLTTYRDIAP